jgi:DNA-binding transcriptional LysR family regulator
VRLLGMTQRFAVASTEYLAGAPALRAPADLARHNCIVYTSTATPGLWHFDGPKGACGIRVRGNLHCNNSEGVRAAVLAGMGVGYSPDWLFLEELKNGTVRKLFPSYRGRVVPVHAVYAAGRAQPLRVRRLVDFLEEEFARDPYVSRNGRRAAAKGK